MPQVRYSSLCMVDRTLEHSAEGQLPREISAGKPVKGVGIIERAIHCTVTALSLSSCPLMDI